MIFRKISLLVLCLLFYGSHLQAYVFGKSLFIAPAFFRPASVEQVSIARYPIELAQNDKRQQFSITLLGSSSTDSKHLARYILPYCGQHPKKTLMAGELGCDAANNNSLDLQAKYFNVLTAPLPENNDDPYIKSNYKFQSQLSFDPTRVATAINFAYKHHLSHYLDRGWWIEVWSPLVVAEQNLKMTEQIISAGGPTGSDPVVPAGYFGNMTQALNQEGWNFGKINGKQRKIGMSDLLVRLGWVYVNEQHYFLNSYLGITVPLCSKPNAEYLFEPTISSNHMGAYSGASAGVRIWAKCEKSIYWILDTAGTLLLSNNQLRSLDLQGRPWSRYLPVFLSDDVTKTVPGINSLTFPVEVKPNVIRDLNMAFVYKHNGLHAEFGFHFYAKSAEQLSLLNNVDRTLAIANDLVAVTDSSGDATELVYKDPDFNQGQHTTKSGASIKNYLQVTNDQNGSGDRIYLPLTNQDLDLTSGAHPAVISNTLYLAAGNHWSDRRYPLFFGFGVGYEIGDDNAALNQIMGWARFDMSF
jgi:hypothetical protein